MYTVYCFVNCSFENQRGYFNILILPDVFFPQADEYYSKTPHHWQTLDGCLEIISFPTLPTLKVLRSHEKRVALEGGT